MSLLSLSQVSFTIQEHQILKDISFDIEKGEIVGLIGPNGSGKTTLFNVISGFLKRSRGGILYKGGEISGFSPSQRARLGMGRVFQNFGIFKEMTLEENVLVALEALPKAEQQELGDLDKIVSATLEMAGLTDFAKKKAGSLSGGQMRLLEIARTLESGKELFLLDEPTAGVSPKMTHQVAGIISKLKEQKKTVLIIEHDLPFIAEICDRVIVLDVGEIVLEGRPTDVQKSKKLQEFYFGADPTT